MRKAALLLLLGLPTLAASARADGTPSAKEPGTVTGPSFSCPVPLDPLAQLVCENPDLSRLDLRFVQTYLAYRQQLPPDGQRALRSEDLDFSRSVRAACGIAMPVTAAAQNAGAQAVTAPPTAAACVGRAYERQRSLWALHLVGAARQEAERPLEQHVALQRELQQLGILPAGEAVDGVFGGATRIAIMSFQQAMGLPVTGLLSDDDAVALDRQSGSHVLEATQRPILPPATTPGRHGGWDEFVADALAVGVRPSFEIGSDGCAVALDVRDPEALAKAALAYRRQSINSDTPADTPHVFDAAIQFMRTEVAAKTVHALYADRPDADACTFNASAFTTDVYGRDVRQHLFHFRFDRATYSKIVWARFNPANMVRIVAAFELGGYAEEQLRGLPAPIPGLDPQTVPAVAPGATVLSPNATQVSAPSVDPSEPGEQDRERRFIAILDTASAAFNAAANDMAKGMSRSQRARDLCIVLPRKEVRDWRGTVETLSSTSDGKGVLVIRIGPHATIGTTNNNLSDSVAPIRTLIEPNSPILPIAAGMRARQAVIFSGSFAASPTDCVAETSLTQAGSMADPEFLFRFTGLKAAD